MLHLVPCPMCQRQFECPPEWAGKHVQCPACGNRFVAGAGAGPTLPTIPVLTEARAYSTTPPAEPPPAEPPPGMASPWAAPSATKPSSRGTLRAVIWSLIGAASFIVALIVFDSLRTQNARRIPFDDPPRDLPRGIAAGKVRVALANLPAVDAATDAAVRRMMDAFTAACRIHDAAAMRRHYDGERLQAEAEAQGMRRFGVLPDTCLDIMEQEHDFLLGVDQFDVASIKSVEDDEVLLHARLKSVKGRYRLRFWLSKQSGEWRIFDSEGLDDFIPASAVVMLLVNESLGLAARASRDIDSVREVYRELSKGQTREAAAALGRVQVQGLHEVLQPSYHVARGRLAIHESRPKDALEDWDRAAGIDPGLSLEFDRAMAYNRGHLPKQALDLLNRYRETWGDGDDSCHETGYAYQSLRRFPEAAAQYRKSLDLEPENNPNSLLALIHCLTPNDAHADLGERFAKLNQRDRCYKLIADDCLQARDAASLEPIALVMSKSDRNRADVQLHLSLVKLWSGKGQDAVQQFATMLERWARHPERQQHLELFLKALVDFNQAEHAYPALENVPEVFPVIAGQLLKTFRSDELRRVVRAHAAKFPADPKLTLFQAAVLAHDEKYDEADKMFQSLAKKDPNAAELHDVRGVRVLTRYRTGHAIAALKEIPAERDTFFQLVALCQADKNDKLLVQILDAYADRHADATELWQNRIRVKIRAKQVDEAVALFKSTWKRLGGQWIENERKQFAESFLMDMVDANKAIEGYKSAPDSKEAFRFLCQDMAIGLHRDEFKELAELHKKAHPGDPWGFLLSGRLHAAEKAWDKAIPELDKARRLLPPPENENAKHELLLARYHACQFLEAFREVGPSEAVFIELAAHCLRDKKWDDLQALIDAHRPLALVDSRLPVYEARLLVGRKRSEEAIPLFTKWAERQTPAGGPDYLLFDLVRDLHQAGFGMEAYRGLPNKDKVFAELASTWTFQKNAKKLEDLLDEHAKNRPEDPKLLLYRGEWHVLRKEYADAEKSFALALAKAPGNANHVEKLRLQAARVKLGKTLDVYRELGSGTTAFESLAQTCLTEKESKQLESLLAERRKTNPDDSNLSAWEVESRWLKKDYQGIVDYLKGDGKKNMTSLRHRWKCEDYLVRALVKLNRTGDAVVEAEKLNDGKASMPYWVILAHTGDDRIAKVEAMTPDKINFGMRLWLILAHASNGDVAKTIALLEKDRYYFLVSNDCYRDPDLGPILRSDAFKPLRDKFPEPPPSPWDPVD